MHAASCQVLALADRVHLEVDVGVDVDVDVGGCADDARDVGGCQWLWMYVAVDAYVVVDVVVVDVCSCGCCGKLVVFRCARR